MAESATETTVQLQQEELEETSSEASRGSLHPYDHLHQYQQQQELDHHNRAVWGEIEEEGSSSDLFEINHNGEAMEPIREGEVEGSLFSFDVHGGEDCVYVGVGKTESSSMDALSWTLKNAVASESTTIYLIHIFPQIHHIPSPLGKLPKSQVSPAQVENYMAQESDKRRQLLQKFINACSASKVKVDTILIESDTVAKAMLDLIPVLNIKKLVLGTSKSSLRKWKSRRGGGIAEQVFEDAPEYCEVKIICEGKEVNIDLMNCSTPSPRGSTDNNTSKPVHLLEESSNISSSNHNNTTTSTNNDSFACMCFKSPRVM
ncbi:hypothetical protein Tsubulata_033013 [Turnera subulata]|uniref:UspA domain-containing protein n=1 Tax=Turnera subulata TaxID=218843 RepID=A0A9Q0FIN4_9ROSI|nr:hypothetical protein Tsubulata_033013 [Turnera subulata]